MAGATRPVPAAGSTAENVSAGGLRRSAQEALQGPSQVRLGTKAPERSSQAVAQRTVGDYGPGACVHASCLTLQWCLTCCLSEE